MSHLYDVAIVGAGPAGSYAASLLAVAGHSVVLLDKVPAEALAPRCTGVVGLPYVELVGVDDEVVLTRARSVTIHSPSGGTARLALPQVQACVLDRALLERRLRRKAVEAGAELRDGVLVTRVARMVDRVELHGMDGGTPIRVAARGLILAAGVSPGLLRQAGLTAPNRYLVGAHAELEMDGVAETEVYLLPDLDRGAFAWLVPLDHRTVRFGVLAHRSAAALARRFLQRPSIRKRLVQLPNAIVQRPVPVSVSRRTCASRVLSVGDAAGQVKPTTGGGLYLGALGAMAAADVLREVLARDDLSTRALSDYQSRWRPSLERDLRQGALARAVYDRLSPSQVDRIIARADRNGVAEALLRSSSFSFDRHGGVLLLGLMRCLPGLVAGPRINTREAAR